MLELRPTFRADCVASVLNDERVVHQPVDPAAQAELAGRLAAIPPQER
jgi:hypothetical protein